MAPKVDVKSLDERLTKAESTLKTASKDVTNLNKSMETVEGNFSQMGEFNDWLKESQTVSATVTGMKTQLDSLKNAGSAMAVLAKKSDAFETAWPHLQDVAENRETEGPAVKNRIEKFTVMDPVVTEMDSRLKEVEVIAKDLQDRFSSTVGKIDNKIAEMSKAADDNAAKLEGKVNAIVEGLQKDAAEQKAQLEKKFQQFQGQADESTAAMKQDLNDARDTLEHKQQAFADATAAATDNMQTEITWLRKEVGAVFNIYARKIEWRIADVSKKFNSSIKKKHLHSPAFDCAGLSGCQLELVYSSDPTPQSPRGRSRSPSASRSQSPPWDKDKQAGPSDLSLFFWAPKDCEVVFRLTCGKKSKTIHKHFPTRMCHGVNDFALLAHSVNYDFDMLPISLEVLEVKTVQSVHQDPTQKAKESVKRFLQDTKETLTAVVAYDAELAALVQTEMDKIHAPSHPRDYEQLVQNVANAKLVMQQNYKALQQEPSFLGAFESAQAALMAVSRAHSAAGDAHLLPDDEGEIRVDGDPPKPEIVMIKKHVNNRLYEQVSSSLKKMQDRNVRRIEWVIENAVGLQSTCPQGRGVFSPMFHAAGIDNMQLIYYPSGYHQAVGGMCSLFLSCPAGTHMKCNLGLGRQVRPIQYEYQERGSYGRSNFCRFEACHDVETDSVKVHVDFLECSQMFTSAAAHDTSGNADITSAHVSPAAAGSFYNEGGTISQLKMQRDSPNEGFNVCKQLPTLYAEVPKDCDDAFYNSYSSGLMRQTLREKNKFKPRATTSSTTPWGVPKQSVPGGRIWQHATSLPPVHGQPRPGNGEQYASNGFNNGDRQQANPATPPREQTEYVGGSLPVDGSPMGALLYLTQSVVVIIRDFAHSLHCGNGYTNCRIEVIAKDSFGSTLLSLQQLSISFVKIVSRASDDSWRPNIFSAEFEHPFIRHVLAAHNGSALACRGDLNFMLLPVMATLRQLSTSYAIKVVPIRNKWLASSNPDDWHGMHYSKRSKSHGKREQYECFCLTNVSSRSILRRPVPADELSASR
eukprot:gene682-266_t